MSDEILELDAEEIPSEEEIKETLKKVEEQITHVLVKRNITDTVINEMKKKYLPLTIQNFDDKEGYNEVKEARKVVKKVRISVSKICKSGREEALRVQKAWKSKEDELVKRIEEVENHLEKQEDEYEAEQARRKAEEKGRRERQLVVRTSQLNEMGVKFDGSNFTLQDVEFDISSIRDTDEEIYQEKILPKFQAVYEKLEADRIEKERLQKEAEERIRKQQEELERQQEQLRKQQEELRQQQEEAARKERERIAEEELKKEQERRELERSRFIQLDELGAPYDYRTKMFSIEAVSISAGGLTDYSEEEWVRLTEAIAPVIEKINKEAEKKKQEEDEVRRKKLEEKLKEELRLKAEQERQAKEAELEKAKDKEKWEDVITYLSATPIHEMRSSQYRTKMKAVKDFLQTIK